MESIVEKIYKDGWAVVDNFIDEEFRSDLLREQQQFLEKGKFNPAGIGTGTGYKINPEIRSDKISWLDPFNLSPLQKIYWDLIDQLRLSINKSCFLGLKSFEAHFAIYPPDTFYLKHLDQFQKVKYRVVSVILYLNRDWSMEDGGALRLYIPQEGKEEKILDVYPLGGRLVVFLSADIPHEVMLTRRERISITGWLRDIENQ